MKFHALVVVLFQAAFIDSVREMSAFLGESVTLLAGSDASWKLAEITWSIYDNETWIATHVDGVTNTHYLNLFTDRLSLNPSTGDLTITNLKPGDELEYTVELTNSVPKTDTNRIKLKLKRPLHKPTITTIFHEGSWIGLYCLSPDEGVTLSWSADPPPGGHLNMINHAGSPQFLLAHFSGSDAVNFSCISKRNTESASNSTRAVSKKTPRIHVALFITGIIAGIGLGLLIAFVVKGVKGNSRGSYSMKTRRPEQPTDQRVADDHGDHHQNHQQETTGDRHAQDGDEALGPCEQQPQTLPSPLSP